MVDSRPVRVTSDESGSNILVTGFIGGMKNGIIELIIYTDTLNPDEALRLDPPDPNRIFIQRKMSGRMILDPIIARQMSNWLNGQISIYEKLFGKIYPPEGSQKSPSDQLGELKKEEDMPQTKQEQVKDKQESEKAAKGKPIE